MCIRDRRRGVQLDPLCKSCTLDIEETDHIFLHCSTVHQVWDLAVLHRWIDSLPFTQQNISLRDQLHVLAQTKSPCLTRVVLLLWSIWKSRNALIFRNESTAPMGTLLRAKRNWAEWRIRASSSVLTPSFSSPHPCLLYTSDAADE